NIPTSQIEALTMNTRLHQMLLCVCIGIGAISTLFYLGFQSSVRDYLKVIGQSGAERSDSAVNRTPVLHNADRIVADLRSKRIIVAIGTSRQPERIEADDLRATFSLEEARSISKLASVTEVRIRKSFVVP